MHSAPCLAAAAPPFSCGPVLLSVALKAEPSANLTDLGLPTSGWCGAASPADQSTSSAQLHSMQKVGSLKEQNQHWVAPNRQWLSTAYKMAQ